MRPWIVGLLAIAAAGNVALADDRPSTAPAPAATVGPAGPGAFLVPTGQMIRSAGDSVEWHGRPVDMALAPDGKTVYIKDNDSLLAIDVGPWKIRQQFKFGGKIGGTMHGIAVSKDGKSVWVTILGSNLAEVAVAPDGSLQLQRKINVSLPGQKGEGYPCGVALPSDGKSAWVCQSKDNALVQIDLEAGQQTKSIPVGVAPFAVVISPDGKRAYVSNLGGRSARAGDKIGKSSGTDVVVDDRGIASTGTISVVDLENSKVAAEIEVGLHPCDITLNADGSTLYVANACSDSVSVLDTKLQKVVETIGVKPDDKLPFGSAPTALALSSDGKRLFVALGGNNAVAIVQLVGGGAPSKVEGFIPAGWYPGSVLSDGQNLFVANVKGIGSRDPASAGKWNSHAAWGTANKISLPDTATLAEYTKRVIEDGRIPQELRAWERAQTGVAPVPVPRHMGEPSVIEHVVYVIKENRSYDQVMGDIGKGNSDPSLCTFGRDVTPNQHALADQFALLDNYYCNGVLSADGHAWATGGYAVDYLEKQFGGWARSYPFGGDDSLALAPTGFIWTDALAHGASFRNYGEFARTTTVPASNSSDAIKDYVKTGKIKVQLQNVIALEPLRQYSCADSPGWNLAIPDQIRADVFLKEFKDAETTGKWPNLVILYLPTDHTVGTLAGRSTPNAMVADNDLAVGRVVDAISHSKFWPKTAIFIIEDDPQNGVDHVDGHRSFCLIASPYTRRNAVVSNFYDQTSLLHTIELILGLPPMNQMDSMAPPMTDCFTDQPDLAPFVAIKNKIPLDETNPLKAEIKGKQLEMAQLSAAQNFEIPDAADDDDLNRILWYSARGWDSRYPAEFAGAHGKGLAKLHLKLDDHVKKDDDKD